MTDLPQQNLTLNTKWINMHKYNKELTKEQNAEAKLEDSLKDIFKNSKSLRAADRKTKQKLGIPSFGQNLREYYRQINKSAEV